MAFPSAWVVETGTPTCSGSGYTFIGGFRWRIESQDWIANTSVVTIQLWAARTGTNGLTNSTVRTSYVEYDNNAGTRQNIGTSFNFLAANTSINTKYYCGTDTGQWLTGNSVQITVNHNSDGTRAVPIHTYHLANMTNWMSVETSVTIVLSTIPRASSLTSSKDWTILNNLPVTISRASSSFTHTLDIVYNSTTITRTGLNTDETITFTEAENKALLTAASSGSVAISYTLTTYNGATLIGTSTYTGTAYKPTLSTVSSSANFVAASDFTINIAKGHSSFSHSVLIYVNSSLIKTITSIDTTTNSSFTLAQNTAIFTQLAQTSSKISRVSIESYYAAQLVGTTYLEGTCSSPNASTLIASDFNIGSASTLVLTVANLSFAHKVKLTAGSYITAESDIVAGVVNTSFNTSAYASQIYNQIPNANFIDTTLTLTTYYNGVVVKTATTDIARATVTNSNPNFTTNPNYLDSDTAISAKTGNNQFIIKGLSTLRINSGVLTTLNAATFVRIDVTFNGTTYPITSNNSFISIGLINLTVDTTATIIGYDSRGNATAPYSLVIDIYDYNKPNYTILAARVNNYEATTNFKVTINNYSSGTPGNSATPTITQAKYKIQSDPDANYVNINTNGTLVSATNYVLTLDNTKQWTITTTVTDGYSTETLLTNLNKGQPIAFFDTTMASMGVGKFPTVGFTLDVGGNTNIDGTLTADAIKDEAAATATTASHYFVETASNGLIVPKTLANVKTELVVASEILTKIKTVDGTGSGLDADLFRGAAPSTFATSAQGTKADNALPSASYTAADVLAKLITVDGAGSGVDADFIDSKHLSNFQGNIQNQLVTFANITLDQSHAGHLLVLGGASSITLPAPNTIANGSLFYLNTEAYDAPIYANGNSVDIPNMILWKHETLVLQSDGGSIYRTVSSGGVYEQGSNANGWYVKFNNGVMICSQTGDIGANCSLVWNKWYITNGNYQWTYPAGFTKVMTSFSGSIAGGDLCAVVPEVMNTGLSCYYRLCRGDTMATVTKGISVTAIGYWR